MTGNMYIPLGMVAVFFGAVIAVLYATNRKSADFTDYAVGGRSYSSWFIAFSFTNSWWPGSVFIGFFGLTVASGVVGFYGLAFTGLGIAIMYFLAERAWRWGKAFDLRTQPDLLGMRFNSPAVKVVASVIGLISVFPWVVLGLQAMGALLRMATFGRWSVLTCLAAGVALIVIRQYWTVRMGMRGLIMTDVFQGLVAYVLTAVICIALLAGLGGGVGHYSRLSVLPENLLRLPGDGGEYGAWYVFSLVATGVIGCLCWPMSFQRIYTASGVRSVKKGTVQTVFLAGGFYCLLAVIALAASRLTNVADDPQNGWFALMYDAGGEWFLGLAVVVVLAATMGHVDGSVQVCGTQIANDLIGPLKARSDRTLTIIAKSSMAAYIGVAAVFAYLSFNYSRLQLIGQISFAGIVQLAVPLFLGIFWKGGNKQGAIASMTIGFLLAAVLTAIYPDDIRSLGSVTSGIVALIVNLVVYVGCHFLFKPTNVDRQRVDQLFALGVEKKTSAALR